MSKPIRAVGRALDVLLCFSREETELTLTEISERVDLHKSTVHRVLATLENKGFVQHDEASAKYRLGLRILELAALVLEHVDLLRQAWPYLHRLSEQHLETVDLSILDGTDVVYLEVIESPQRVKLAAAPGRRLPACCTAAGKVFLAYMSEREIEPILATRLLRYTPQTIVSPEEFRAELRTIRERGFATAASEFEPDINAVAAPILDYRYHTIAAVALAGPSFRLSGERLLALGPSVRQCADDIAREVGPASALIPDFNHAEALHRSHSIRPEYQRAAKT